MKRCTWCGGEFALANFYRNKSRPDGLSDRCKRCHAEAVRQSQARKRAANQANKRAIAAATDELRDRHRVEYEAILQRLLYEDGAS